MVKSYLSAPPSIFRPCIPQSLRSSGVDFGDAESVQNPSEAGDDWDRDETPQSPRKEERNLILRKKEMQYVNVVW